MAFHSRIKIWVNIIETWLDTQNQVKIVYQQIQRSFKWSNSRVSMRKPLFQWPLCITFWKLSWYNKLFMNGLFWFYFLNAFHIFHSLQLFHKSLRPLQNQIKHIDRHFLNWFFYWKKLAILYLPFFIQSESVACCC